jgi:pimeloyl-ACP methyl ester carboxylesterase
MLIASIFLAQAGADNKGATMLIRPAAVRRPSATLLPELHIAELRPLVKAYGALPASDMSFATERDGRRLNVAIKQRGNGNNNLVIVMIHGVLSRGDAWRYVAGELGQDFDLWIVDLPGCGRSDKPDPDSLGPNGYSPTAMADRVLQALEQCLASRPQRPRLMLVAHSLGGMVALQMMGNPELRQRHARVLQQIESMMLVAPCDVASVNQEILKFKAIVELSGLKVAIANWLGVLIDAAAKADRNGLTTPELATRETTANLHDILTHTSDRRAAQAMLLQAVPWNFEARGPDWEEILRLESHYGNINVPCHILWGQRDETLSVAMGYKLEKQIPGAKLIVLSDCKHSPNLECPTIVASEVRNLNAAVSARRNLQVQPGVAGR